jgi:hypothetical protein
MKRGLCGSLFASLSSLAPRTNMAFYWENEVNSPELQEIHRLRDLALQSPLRRGDSLSWIGPTHKPSSLPLDDQFDRKSALPNGLRSPFERLLVANGPAKSSERWRLKLGEPLQAGANGSDDWGQIWRARAAKEGDEGRENSSVVVKLYQESLFCDPKGRTIPEEGCYARLTAAQTEEWESRVYR